MSDDPLDPGGLPVVLLTDDQGRMFAIPLHEMTRFEIPPDRLQNFDRVDRTHPLAGHFWWEDMTVARALFRD